MEIREQELPPLQFKRGLKVYVCDRKDILKVVPTENKGVITFEYASGMNYTKFGKCSLIEADVSALTNRNHPEHFAEMDSMAQKVIVAMSEMSNCDTIVIQCGSAEIRSVATARAFRMAKDWFGGFFLWDDKKKMFAQVDQVPVRYSGGLGRYKAWLEEAIYEATVIEG